MKLQVFTFILFFVFLILKDAYSQETSISVGADSTTKNNPRPLASSGLRRCGFSVSSGISKVLDSDYPHIDTEDSTITKPLMPSAQFGFYFNLYFGKRSMVSFEPCISLIQGNARRVTRSPGRQNIEELRKRLCFFSLPISYGLNFRKGVISIGIQPSFLFCGQTQTNNVYITAVGSIPRGHSDYKTIHSNPFDLGAKVEASYNCYKRLSVFLNAYYGFMDIYPAATGESNRPTWYQRQVMIGAKCALS